MPANARNEPSPWQVIAIYESRADTPRPIRSTQQCEKRIYAKTSLILLPLRTLWHIQLEASL